MEGEKETREKSCQSFGINRARTMIDAFDLFSLCTPAGPAASTNRVIEISITHRSPPLLSPSLPPSSLSIESEGGRTVVRVGEEWILFSLSLLSSSPPPPALDPSNDAEKSFELQLPGGGEDRGAKLKGM